MRQRERKRHVKKGEDHGGQQQEIRRVLTRLQEELMTAATQHSVAWRFGNWTARQRLLLVHERLLRDVRKNLQRLNSHVLKESPNSSGPLAENSNAGPIRPEA